jgi:hypothetical protein
MRYGQPQNGRCFGGCGMARLSGSLGARGPLLFRRRSNVNRSALLVAYETSEPSLFDAVQGSGPRKATPERLARRYRPACVIDAVCPAMVTSVDRCAPVFAGMNSST